MTRPGRGDKRKDKEKKAGAGWAPGAGTAASTADLAPGVQAVSAAARGAQAVSIAARGTKALSPFLSFLQRMAESLGLGALVSSQTGLVALTLGVATLAAGAAALIGLAAGGKAAAPDSPFYASRFAMPGRESASALTGADLPRDDAGGPTSLDMLAKANPGGGEGKAEGTADAPAEAPASEESAPPPAADAPAGNHPAGPKPTLIAAKPVGGASSQSGGGLKQMAGLNTGIGQNFQDTFKGNGAGKLSSLKTQPKASYRASRKAVSLGSGRKALSQLKAANALSRKAASMSSSNSQSATASTPFDGANPGAGASAPGNTGLSQGGAGIASGGSPAISQNTGQPAEPPSPGEKKSKNQTPYQNMIIAGIAAMALGMVLLMIAGLVIGQAQKAPDLATKASLYSLGKMLAMGAMACGGLAAGMGAMIAGKFGQQQQGIMFIAGGGMLAASALMVLITAEKESQKCQQDVQAMQRNVGGAINQANTPQGMASGQ